MEVEELPVDCGNRVLAVSCTHTRTHKHTHTHTHPHPRTRAHKHTHMHTHTHTHTHTHMHTHRHAHNQLTHAQASARRTECGWAGDCCPSPSFPVSQKRDGEFPDFGPVHSGFNNSEG